VDEEIDKLVQGERKQAQMSQKELDAYFRETPPDVDPDDELDEELQKLEDELPERYKKLL